MKVEFLLAFEDHTWDTQVLEVPDSVVRGGQIDSAISYARQVFLQNPQYSGVVLVSVYKWMQPTE